ncbi:cache domain-containing protein, partial [Campylobacter majalis]|uniref:cache domain-containing protein n=1 Tax=Campylobacter majalis TaxID=2790656 RepID=UPI003D68A46D
MQKLANKLAVIVLLLLTVSFLVFSAISYNKSKETIVDLSIDSKQISSVSAKVFVEEFYATKIVALEGFERYIKNNPYLINDKELLKEDLNKMAFLADVDEIYIGFADNGEMLGVENAKGKDPSMYHKGPKENFDARIRPWYGQIAAGNGDIVYFEPYMTTTSNKYAMGIGKALIINGKTVGVIAVDIYLDDLKKELILIKDTKTAEVSIVDIAKGYFIYHENYDRIMSKSPDDISVIKSFTDSYSKNPSNGFVYEYKGETKVGACEKYDQANWLVCSANYMSDYDEILNEVLTSQLVF